MAQTAAKTAAKAAAQTETVVKETVKKAAESPFTTPVTAASMREAAETSVKQAKETYDKLKVAAEEATELLEESFATATKGATDINRKLIEAFKANADAHFDLFRDMVGVKSAAEAVELHTAFLRKQMTAYSTQTKDIAELAKDVVTKATKPLGDKAMEAFKQMTPKG